MIAKGSLPEGTELTPMNPMTPGTFSEGDVVRPWDTLSDEEKWLFSFVGEFAAEQDGEGLGEVPERHFGDTADSAHEWRPPEGIRGRRSATAARVPPDHTRVGRARWPARASVRSDGAGVGLDVGEHAAAVPAREGPYEP